MNRRNVLKGLGVSVALPYMPSLYSANKSDEKPPIRFAALVMANGINPHEWWIDEKYGAWDYSRSLKPMEAMKGKCSILKNLSLFPDEKASADHRHFTNILSGVKMKEENGLRKTGITLEQYLGKTLGKNNSIPSLSLGLEPVQVRNNAETGTAKYFTVSWSSPTSPVVPEIFPRQAFDRLFNTKMMLEDKSILDKVYKQAKSIRRDLSIHDQQKMDQYLTSVREVEQRIQKAAQENRGNGWQPTLTKPDIKAPEDGKPSELPLHTQNMLDIIRLAFQADKTRFASFLFAADASYNMRFDFLDGVDGRSLHGISHHKEKKENLEIYMKVNRWHVEQLMYLMREMDKVDEGNGTLLDNTMLFLGSNMWNGDLHQYHELPVIIAGGKNAGWIHDRLRKYEGDEKRKLCNLWIDVAQRAGLPIEKFGNGSMALEGLS